MKHLLAFLFFLLFVAEGYSQPATVQIRPLQDYHFLGTARLDLKNRVNCFVITNRKQYNEFFGESTQPDTPYFSKEWMLVLLMPSSNRDSKLSFSKVDMKAGDFIEVYCTMKLNKGRMPYEAYPIAACAIPKYAGIKKLNFYNEKGMKLLETVVVK